jgi:hypothetical protein
MMGLLLVAILVVPFLLDRLDDAGLAGVGRFAMAAAAPLIGPGRFAHERLVEARA